MSLWQIERLGRRGDGIATGPDGKALASLTLPGEQVEGMAVDGRIASPRIVTPSPDRVRATCPHYRSCGGCSLMHGSDQFVHAWKQRVVTTALGAQGVQASVTGTHVSPPMSRRRAVLSGRRTKKSAQVGFHAKASDMIVDVQECQVIEPRILQTLPLLRRIVSAGASRSAELSLTVIAGPSGLDVAVTGGKAMDSSLFQTLAALAEAGDLARLDWDGQPITRRTPYLDMAGAQLAYPPAAFLQATPDGEDALQRAVGAIVGEAEDVVDLFSGCGTFTLPLAAHAGVHAVEGLAPPLAALDNAWRNAPGLRRVTTEIRDLARNPLLADELDRFDAIVIDPPRSGAEAQSRQIAASQVGRVAFVACDPVTFARDARILTQGGYRIGRLWVVDQFRWSPHVETVTEFVKT
ncbi:class I SAM-dependent RNA methyltransferase [Paracoccus sp. Z330]|uniref:Class I SAM-dependent RNA methyltransferase n=1 Tax=Paracoccus onchidii TaxID=3017813 RepID=A0ABT4ZCD9_9RHOB|nr:class I SAM-dependent RNA methyltransferase [Paracoccus onchidii]MDB6176807.1 class I SAM-dependent RNA methyltransferase [Paracoccus onchidii]